MKDLETQVSDFESEAARLSQSLETQKATASNAASAASKRLEEVSKELQQKVHFYRALSAQLIDLDYRRRRPN